MRNIKLSDLYIGKRLIPSHNIDDEYKNYNPEDWVITDIKDGKVFYKGGGYDTIDDALNYRVV